MHEHANHTRDTPLRVAVLGASGYSGGELLRLLAAHPGTELVAAGASERAGMSVADVHPHLTPPSAGALAVLDVIEDEGLLANATAMGERLGTGLAWALAEAGLDTAPRGRGLLVGVPVAPSTTAAAVILALLRRGFLTTEAGGNVVRCTPPLTVDASAVEAFVQAFAEAAREASGVPGGSSNERSEAAADPPASDVAPQGAASTEKR